MAERKSITERFWSKVAKAGPDECWPWIGARIHQTVPGSGHGSINIAGKSYLAHRVAWHFLVGEVPNGACVLHRCDNPPCVNPAHLFLGTQRQNVADCVAKGRNSAGKREGHGKARLTQEQVDWIRSTGMTCIEMSRILGVSRGAVQNARSGTTWPA